INNFGLPPDTAYFARLQALLAPGDGDDLAASAAHAAEVPGDAPPERREAPKPALQADDVRAVGLLLWQLLWEPGDLEHDGPRDRRPDVPASRAALLRGCCALPGGEPLLSAASLMLALEEVAERLAGERPAGATATPPALRAARVAVEEAAAWAMEETLESN